MIRKPLFLIVLAALTACSLQNFDRQDGLIWSADTDGPVACGVEIRDNGVFFADSFSSIYCLWIDSGLLRWKRTLTGEAVTAVQPAGDSLVVVSERPVTGTVIRHYSYDAGEIVFQTNLALTVAGNVESDGTNIILHTSDRVVIYHPDNGGSEVYVLAPLVGDIRAVVKCSGGWFVVDGRSKIVRTDASFRFLRAWTDFEGLEFAGSAVYQNNILFLATEGGVKALSSSGAAYDTTLAKPVSAPLSAVSDPFLNVLYAASDSPQRPGLGKYGVVLNDLSEDWFRPLYAPVTHSPVAYSDSLSVVAVVDDTGQLNVFDAMSGAFVNSLFVGIINRPGLSFGLDYFSQSVFVPVSAPSRVVCYSLNYAVNKRLY